MKIIWSPLAIERAFEAAAYIAHDKPQAALAWLDGLSEAVDRLEKFPRSGRIVSEIGLDDYREIVYRSNHRIVYRTGRVSVEILTVRNCGQLLDPTDLVE